MTPKKLKIKKGPVSHVAYACVGRILLENRVFLLKIAQNSVKLA